MGGRFHSTDMAARARLSASPGAKLAPCWPPHPRVDHARDEPDAGAPGQGRPPGLAAAAALRLAYAGQRHGRTLVGVTPRAGESRRGREATMAAWPMSPPPVVEDEVEATDH